MELLDISSAMAWIAILVLGGNFVDVFMSLTTLNKNSDGMMFLEYSKDEKMLQIKLSKTPFTIYVTISW